MRQKPIALAVLIALSSLAGCALPQTVAPPQLPTAGGQIASAASNAAVPVGPGGLSVAPVTCPQSSHFLFCVGVLP